MLKIKVLVDLVGLFLLVEPQKVKTTQKIRKPFLYQLNNQYHVMLVEVITVVKVVQYLEPIITQNLLVVYNPGMITHTPLELKELEGTVKLMIINLLLELTLILKLEEEVKKNGLLCNKLYMKKVLQLQLLLLLDHSNIMMEEFMINNVYQTPSPIMLF